jgi:hypothetical protein
MVIAADYMPVLIPALIGIVGAIFTFQQHEISRVEFVEPRLASIATSINDQSNTLTGIFDAGLEAQEKCSELVVDLITIGSLSDELFEEWLINNSEHFAPELELIRAYAEQLRKSYQDLPASPFARSVLTHMTKDHSSYQPGVALDYINDIFYEVDGIGYAYKRFLGARSISDFSSKLAHLASVTDTRDFLKAMFVSGIDDLSPLEFMGIVLLSEVKSVPDNESILINGNKLQAVVVNVGLANLIALYELLPKSRKHLVNAMEEVLEISVGSRIDRVLKLINIGEADLLGADVERVFRLFRNHPEMHIWFYTIGENNFGQRGNRVIYDHKNPEHKKVFAKLMKNQYTV